MQKTENGVRNTGLILMIWGMIALILAASMAQADTWDLSSADTRMTIGVSGDRPVILCLESTKTGHNWAGSGVPVPLMEKVWIGEREIPTRWAFRKGVKRSGKLTLTFVNTDPAMELRSVWRARSGHGPVEHWIEIENLSPERITVSHQDSLSLHGLNAGKQAMIWWITRGAANASTQGGVYQESLSPDLDLALNGNCMDGASPVPWTAVQVGEEHGLYAGWEFSGLGRIQATGKGVDKLDLSIGNHLDFKTDVPPGETFLVPPAFVGCYAGDVEEGSYCLHRFIVEKLRPRMPAAFPDPSINCSLYLDAGGANAKEADVMRVAGLFHDLGIEMFMPDAMWFPATGDWRWDPARFPQGIKPIEEYVHSHGMKQGLWCAWTNGGVSEAPGALSVRGQYGHPDWFNDDYPSDWQPGPFYGALACLASPEMKDWAIKKTQWLVKNHKLDYLKHDIHPIVTSCNKTDHRHGYGVDVSYWAAMGYYEIMEKLHKACPDVVLENCSGAGHIKDFGAMQRTHYIATTDTLSNLPDRQSFYDSTYAFPPLVLQAYTYERGYNVKGDDPGTFLWRSAMMGGWHVAPTNSAIWTEAEKESLRRSIEIYRDWIRPILKDAKVYHILPRPDGVHWDGMFYWSPSLRKGTVYIFRPDAKESRRTVRLKGLEPWKEYKVRSEDGSVSAGTRSGEYLVDHGLDIFLPERYSSDLIYISEA